MISKILIRRVPNNLCLERLLLLPVILCVWYGTVQGQLNNRQAPPFLIEEIHRLARDCFYFNEYTAFTQQGNAYLLATFLNAEGIRYSRGAEMAVPSGRCAPRPQQVRLYRFLTDSTVLFRDSIFIDRFAVGIGTISDFNQSGTAKVVFTQNCGSQGREHLPPLLCFAFSLYEITEEEMFRNTITLPNVPRRATGGVVTREPLEPVYQMNIDKNAYPELLAVDDFFEGDPAFRRDDFPRITLVYAWDDTAGVFRHASRKFRSRFRTVDLPVADSVSLVEIVESIMTFAATGREHDAYALLDAVMTQERVAQWHTIDPDRRQHITVARLRTLADRYIARYRE